MFRSLLALILALVALSLALALLPTPGPIQAFNISGSSVVQTSQVPPWTVPTASLTNTLVLAHWLGWFGLPNHRQLVPPYVSTNPEIIRRQIMAAQAKGIDGFIVDWYGPATGLGLPNEADRAFIDQATQALFAEAAQTPGFQVALMYDYGTLSYTAVASPTSQMIADLTYALNTYLTHTTYLSYNGQPLLFLFPNEQVVPKVHLATVTNLISPANVSLIYQNPITNSAIFPYVDGFFAWVQPITWQLDGNDWGEDYLNWFYQTMADPTLPYSQMLTVGAVWPGFNDSLAPWRTGPPRFIARRDGQTWEDTWDRAITYQPPLVQIVTWNDWEEGTAIEPGESLGTWVGTPIHRMDVVTPWFTMTGVNAISVTLAKRAGHDDGAVEMAYALTTSPAITQENWVQMRHDFNLLDISQGDHLRFFHQGTATNTLQIGLVSNAGQNYFSSDMKKVTQVPWWTYATWDLQDFQDEDGQLFPDFSQVRGIFISVKKSDNEAVGGHGSFSVDGLQYLKLVSRPVPSDFEIVTAIPPTVTQLAATWIAGQQKSNGLLQSWHEEGEQGIDYAWLYDQALGLIVLSETDLPKADDLATKLYELQNADGSWYEGYHYLTNTEVSTQTPIGANAWLVYALGQYFLRSGNPTAYQAAQEGADWLATLQRSDGSLPAQPGETTAPTEPNLDAWWAFQATRHHTQANALRDFLLEKVWDNRMGRFKASPDSHEIFLDNQTWGAAFLRAIGRDEEARRALSYAQWTLATCSSNGLVCGFDGAGPFSVWNEGTLHYVAQGGENSQYYWDQMVNQQASDGGLPGSPEPDEFRAYSVWLTPMHGVAPTAWLYFAGTKGPFHVAPASIDITGPVNGFVQTSYTFTTIISPVTTAQPITYIWQATGHSLPLSPTISHTIALSWNTPGQQILTVTATNAGGIVTDTHTISLEIASLTGVSISGPQIGVLNKAYTFTAAISPLTATKPITYIWSPVPGNRQGMSVITYIWTTTGLKIIELTATNRGGNIVTATHAITVSHLTYLPLIKKE